MKTKIYIIIGLFLATQLFSQTQQKIPWPSLADSPWPVARGDVQGTGRSEYVGPKTPNVIWRKTFTYGVFNAPVLDKDGNLLFGTRSINWSEGKNYFYKTDSQGKEIWRYETDNGLANDCAPAVAADGTIYFGSQSSAFYALNGDGTLKWKYQSNSTFNIKNVVLDKEGNIYTSSGDSLFSFTPEGLVRFSLGISSIGKGLSMSPDGELIYAPVVLEENRGFLYAITRFGEVKWNLRINIVFSTVLVDNSGFIYLKGEEINNPEIGEALICLNPDGEIQWEFEVQNLGGGVGGVTMDKNGNIYFFANQDIDGKETRVICSLNYYGSLRWYYIIEDNLPVQDYEDIEHGLVCDADGTVYAGSTFGNYLYAISSEGKLLWKLPLEGLRADSSPVIAKDGSLYIGLHHGASSLVENNLIAIKDDPNSVEDQEIPREFELFQNYPNPFNPTTIIKFTVPNVGTTHELSLRVYDILGREVATLVNDVKPAGSYEVTFDASDLSSGIYFVRMVSGSFVSTKKIMLIK